METDPGHNDDVVSNEFYARCPHCGAVFRVDEHKLQLRQGKVRCGACREVFNAPEYQVVRNQLGIFEELAGPAQQETDQFAGVPVEEEFAEELPNAVARPMQSDVSARQSSVREILERNLGEASIDPLHNDVQDEPRDGPVDVTGDARETMSAADPEDQPLDSRPETAQGSARDHWFRADPDPVLDNNPFADRSSRSPFSATVRNGSSERQAPSQINMQGVDEYIMDRPNPLVGFFWFLVSVGFVVLLGVQVKYYFVDRFAQDERYRPYLSLFCKVASCELQPRRDAYRFTITNTRIDLHPAEPGALRITVKLLNQAEFSQPYPDLQLTLTDRVGRVVGRRSFEPSFFLEPDQANQLGSGDLGSVVFDLARPHEKAVGFVVDIVHTPS